MDADDLDPATYAAVVGDLAKVNAVTMARAADAELPAARARRAASASSCSMSGSATATCCARSRAGRRSAGSRPNWSASTSTRAANWRRRRTRPPDMAIRWVTGDYADLAGEGWDMVDLQPGRASHDARPARRLPALHGPRSARWAGWSTTSTATASRIGASRCWRACSAGTAIVRHDGTLSIARSYRPDEWPPILAEAGRRRRPRLSRLPVPAVRRTPALIVGGGPAGAAAAMLLARAGIAASAGRAQRARPATRLCGGFLSWRTLETLERDRRRGAARSTATTSAGCGCSRARARPRRGCRARRSRCRAGGSTRCCWTTRSPPARRSSAASRCARRRDDASAWPTTATIAADALFLATGKHDLRGLARPVDARRRPDAGPARPARRRPRRSTALVGGTIELHLFDRGYAGLARQEDGTVNLLHGGAPLAADRGRVARRPARRARPRSRRGSASGSPIARRGAAIDAVANVPYGWRARRHGAGPVPARRSGARASPASRARAWGSRSKAALRAATAYLRGGPDAAVAYQQRLARDLAAPVRGRRRDPRTPPSARSGRARSPGPCAWRHNWPEIAAQLTRIRHMPLDA